MDDDVDRDRWNAVHRQGTIPLLEELRRATLTEALPAEVENTTLWPAWPLDEVAEALALEAGETMIDVGCGNGDIGRWIARSLGVRVIGIDPASEAVTRAAERARDSGIDVSYREGHFRDTGLDDASGDAVLVVDAFHFVTDEDASLTELARILRPGRRLVVVGPEPDGRRWKVAGLTVVQRTETPAWREKVQAFRTLVQERQADLAVAMGERGAADLLARISTRLPAWHGMVVAERRPW